MVLVREKSVKYHVYASLLRSIVASCLLHSESWYMNHPNKNRLLVPLAGSALCLYRLIFDDYYSIRLKYPDMKHLGTTFFSMISMSTLLVSNFRNSIALVRYPVWIKVVVVLAIWLSGSVMAKNANYIITNASILNMDGDDDKSEKRTDRKMYGHLDIPFTPFDYLYINSDVYDR